MSRKHFIALARALRDAGASADLIEAIADVCAALNPNFNRAKFRAAAGGK
jgi:hypothetical protein